MIGTGKVKPELFEKYNFSKDGFIKVYGWLSYDDFTKLICCADLFSLIQEDTLRNRSRFPNKMGDYLAVGRPIIANQVGEVRHYAEKYPEAFYIIEDHPIQIEKALCKAYTDWQNNNINYRSIRDIAIENSWRQRAKELSKFYEKICYN